MHSPLVRTLATAVACLAVGTPSQAQSGIPGGGGGSAPRHIAEYYAYVLEEVSRLTSAYEAAWAQEGDEDLLELYDEEAALVVGADFRVRGREAIVARLRELWPRRWSVRLSIVDFEASGEMGFIYGQLGEAPGKHVTLMKRSGRDWRIVRQFLLDVDASESGSP